MPQDLPLEHDQPGRAGQLGEEGHAGRRYQLVFRLANILPVSLSRVMFTSNIKTINKLFCAKLVLLYLNVAPVPGIALG